MIMGGRRSREAEQQADRLRQARMPYQPHMPALARIILGSRVFQRLMERLDTREGVKLGKTPRFNEPTPSRPSERLLPERGPFVPRMHPLGGMVFRTRFVQRLLGNPIGKIAAPVSDSNGPKSEGHADESAEDRSRSDGRSPDIGSVPATTGATRPLTDAQIREIRQKALISSLLHSSSRWGGR